MWTRATGLRQDFSAHRDPPFREPLPRGKRSLRSVEPPHWSDRIPQPGTQPLATQKGQT